MKGDRRMRLTDEELKSMNSCATCTQHGCRVACAKLREAIETSQQENDRLKGAIQEWIDGVCISQKYLSQIGKLEQENEKLRTDLAGMGQMIADYDTVLQENEQLQAQAAEYQSTLNQIHQNLCKISKEMDKTIVLPEDYHNPADVEALKQVHFLLECTECSCKIDDECPRCQALAKIAEVMGE
jgi:DNA repair ATPase RecN